MMQMNFKATLEAKNVKPTRGIIISLKKFWFFKNQHLLYPKQIIKKNRSLENAHENHWGSSTP